MKKSQIPCDDRYCVQVCQIDLKIIIIMLKIMLMHLFCAGRSWARAKLQRNLPIKHYETYRSPSNVPLSSFYEEIY